MTDHPAQVRAIADRLDCILTYRGIDGRWAEHLRAAATRMEQLEQAHQHLIDKWRAHAKSNDNMLGGGPWDAGQSCALDMCADDLAALLPAPPAAPAAPTTDEDETLP